MMRNLKRAVLRLLSYVFSDRMSNWMTSKLARQLAAELRDAATDQFLDLLLRGMDLAFCLSRSYRRNIKDFTARYVFRTDDGTVGVTADFAGTNMRVHQEAEGMSTARVTFANAAALRSFLFAEDQDIFKLLLANEVEVDGNLNYMYKFGFMVKDLMRRLGVR